MSDFTELCSRLTVTLENARRNYGQCGLNAMETEAGAAAKYIAEHGLPDWDTEELNSAVGLISEYQQFLKDRGCYFSAYEIAELEAAINAAFYPKGGLA